MLLGVGVCGGLFIVEDGILFCVVGFCNINELFEVYIEMVDCIEVLKGFGFVFYGLNVVYGVVNVIIFDIIYDYN